MADARRGRQEAKEEVKRRLDITQVVSESVMLKRSGRSYKGLCPFHDEKTPSFAVFPDSQHFKCFGCGEGGDVFAFVMKKEGLGFPEALQLLAERAGVPLPRQGPAERRATDTRKGLVEVLRQVQAGFAEALHTEAAAAARAYVAARGLSPAIPEFGIGFARGPAPAASFEATQWPLAGWFRRKGIPAELGIELGLLGRSRSGVVYDRFRNRVTFPIHDERGRIVGFGGRILPGHETETEPKYLNTPESPVFNKRRVLFGLHQARQQNARRLVVMEGYTDVIAAQLAGVRGAVATLGTSLTTEHATLLRRFAPDGITLLFDGDDAGRRAAERAYQALASEVMPARVALLDRGLDPAAIVDQQGGEALEQIVAQAEDALEVFLQLLGQRLDLKTHAGKAEAVADCCAVLAGIANRFRREDLMQRFATRLFLAPDVLAAAVRELAGRGRTSRPAAPPAERPVRPVTSPESKARLSLLAALIKDPSVLADLTEGWPGEDACFPDPFQRRLVHDLLQRFLERGAFPSPSELLDRWLTLADDESETALVMQLEETSRTLDDPAAGVRHGVEFLRMKRIRAEYDRLREAYGEALRRGEAAGAKKLEARLTEAARQLAGS